MKEPQIIGPGDCLPKTHGYANSQEDVYGLTPARCRKVKRRAQYCLNHELGEIVVPVKMPDTRNGTERPREPLLQLCIDFG